MCENHDYCYVQMPNNENKILEYKHSQKSKRVPFVIYSYLECLLQKTNDENNDQNKSTIKINNHIPCGYSIYTQCSFDNTKNKLDHYRGEDCMKKFADSLNDHVSIIINYEQKKLIKLTEEEYENHRFQKKKYIRTKKEINKELKNDYYNYKYVKSDLMKKITKSCRGVKKCSDGVNRMENENQRENLRSLLSFKEETYFKESNIQ